MSTAATIVTVYLVVTVGSVVTLFVWCEIRLARKVGEPRARLAHPSAGDERVPMPQQEEWQVDPVDMLAIYEARRVLDDEPLLRAWVDAFTADDGLWSE